MSILNLKSADEQAESKAMPRSLYGLIALSAFVIIATISYSTYLSNRSANAVAPLIDAAHEIRTTSSLAHLWTEELLLRDPDIHIEDIINYYDLSSGYISAMLNGGEVHGRAFPAVEDMELRDILQQTRQKIAVCREMTRNRFTMQGKAIVGTDMDQNFDRSFKDLLETAAKIEERLHAVIDHNMKIFHFIQSGLIMLSFLLSVAVGLMVFRFDRRRTGYLLTIEGKNQQLMAAEQQLKAANQQLLAGEQQLRASNQQLMANEQQLKAANQQLLAGEQQLRASNQQLMASEQALRESENHYRSLFTDMAEGVALHRVIYDGKGSPVNYEIINVNPQYETILNIPREQVIGKLATDAYDSPEPPYLAEFSRVAETGAPYRFETYFPPLKKHLDISVSPFEEGCFATIFSDITLRKQAEEAIRLNEERLEILWDISRYTADSVKDLLDYALEKSLRITRSSIGYIYHYNEDSREFVLNSWSKGVMDECMIQKKETIYQLDKTGIWGEAVRQRKPIVLNDYQAPHLLKKGCPEGHAALHRFMTIPVIIDGRVMAVVGVANKVEEYDQNDVKQLTLLMDSVWKLVEKLQFSEERLSMQTQMQKLESLGILAGGIAHDFNNLLTAVLANINIVSLRMKGDEKIFTRLSEAEKACLRAQNLTEQLLTFASGGAPVKSLIYPHEVIRDSARFAVRGTSVVCEFSIASDLWAIEADEGQIGQVISNLVINAVQAMPEGGVVKIIAVNEHIANAEGLPLREGPYVKIMVDDKGTGIREEHLQKIFDPYFTTKQKGSGLGLAITYSIIKKHDGHITVRSGSGRGSVFSVYVPAAPGELSAENASVNEIAGGRGHVLLMEDEEIVAKAAGAILEEFGYDVSVAKDGRKALELYLKMKDSETPIDLVIMDLTIPGGMGGKEAIQELLKIDPHAKAIVSSGYSTDAIMADFRAHGFKGVIPKPYKVHELFETINRVMNDLP